MDELIAFLRERLGEREQIARAAEADTEAHWSPGDKLLSDYVTTAEYGNPVAVGPYEGFMSWELRQHIALHDPADALADVDAKQRIIDLWDLNILAGSYFDALAEVLLLLAASFSAHPDYREEWKP